MIYLACPYSHSDPAVRQARFEAANRAAADLMRQGRYVFSPISHTHPIAMAGKLPLDWDYWQGYDRVMIYVCTELIVLQMDGWQESRGVKAEVEIAGQRRIPVRYLPPLEVPSERE